MKSIIIIITITAILSKPSSTRAQDDDEDFVKIRSELELIQWDLEDECSNMARNEKGFYMQEVTGLRDKIRGEVDRANFLRLHAARLKVYEEVPYELQRNWTYFTKCGDVLLSEDEFKAFNIFANKNLELKLIDTIKVHEATLDEADVLEALATRRNASQLQDVWNKWASGTKPFKEWYYSALKMVNRATLANDYTEVETYWEMLSNMQSGYELSERLFEELQPLYNKLHNFVRLRINQHYNTTYEEYFPTYLSGSFLGDDWSNIADILLPNPQLYYDMKVELEAREMPDLYRYAGNATKNLGFGDVVNPSFMQRSDFTSKSCATKVFDYCSEQYSSILTCNKASIGNYFNAYETVMRLGLTKVNFASKVNENLRLSPVLDGMQTMAALLSVNGLLQHKIVGKTVFSDHVTREESRMTVLLLLALRILPKIAYYHTMDKFRMDLLANHGDVEAVYRKHVRIIQGLSFAEDGAGDDAAEFLREELILFNKPYLSKMLGLFLQFQLLDHYQIDLFEETDASTLFNSDTTFRDFVLSIPQREAGDLLTYYYNIDEISEYNLIAFFAPLNEYLDVAPLDQAAFKLRAPKFVRTTTTTTTQAPKTKRVRTNSKTTTSTTTSTEHVVPKVAGVAGVHAADLNHNLNVRDEVMHVQVNANGTNEMLLPAQAPVNLGIYIGAGIVVVTLAIIAGGFVTQRRRTQRNNRRYNA